MTNRAPGQIILVDDNEHFRIYMSMFLEDEGCSVTAFRCLDDALFHIKSFSDFSTLLLDYFDNGSAVDGDTLLALRPHLHGARLILMSACDVQDRLKIEGLVEKGVVDGFFPKMPDYKTIKDGINKLLI